MRPRERLINHCRLAAICLAALVLLAVFVERRLVARRAAETANINDLSVPAEDVLALSADVAKVEVLLAPSRPTHRIIHIGDSHYLPRDSFTKYSEWFVGRILPDKQVHDAHQAHADKVELFQTSQKALLSWLVDRHALRQVFGEAVSQQDLPAVMRRAESYRKNGAKRERLLRETARMPSLIRVADANDRDSAPLRKRQKKLERFRGNVLLFGAAGQLVVERPFVDLLPAEDEQAYQEAHVEHRNVMFEMDFDRLRRPCYKAREAAIVRNLLAHGPCAVIILGRAHDLSEEIQKQSGGRCEYLKVTTRNFPERSTDWPPIRR